MRSRGTVKNRVGAGVELAWSAFFLAVRSGFTSQPTVGRDCDESNKERVFAGCVPRRAGKWEASGCASMNW